MKKKDTQKLLTVAKGQAMVEMAIVAPIMLTLMLAIAVFGIAFDQYLALTFATSNSAQLLSISRGQTSDPCQTTSQAALAAAPQLNPSKLKFSITLGANPVVNSATNPSCSGSQQYLVQAQKATVTATYPCNLQIFGVNPVPNCTMTATSSMAIQ